MSTDIDEHSSSGSFFTRITQLFKPVIKEPKNISQLQHLISQADKKSFLPPDVAAMVDGVLQVSEMRVRDIMIPRSQIIVLNKNNSIADNLEVLIESAHSRFPVIDDSMDEVVGTLLAKDLLHWCIEDKPKNAFDLNQIIRPVIFVPQSKRLNIMLREFRNQRNHIAVVVDEYGGTAGLITIEDVLEQIVGDIVDEHDDEDANNILCHSKIRHTVKATTELEEFNEYFEVNLERADIDTVGGLVIHSIGHLPKRGETVDVDNFRFKVLRADKRRVYLLQVNLLQADASIAD